MFAADVLFGTESEKMGLVVGKVNHRLAQKSQSTGLG